MMQAKANSLKHMLAQFADCDQQTSGNNGTAVSFNKII